MRWAEIQYPDPRKANAAVTTAGKAVVTASTTTVRPQLPNLKKPASSMKPEEIRAEISNMVRKQLLPALAEKFPPGKEVGKQPEKKAT